MKKTGRFLAVCAVLFCVATVPVRAESSFFTPVAHWFANRVADFMDIFSVGAGLTFENKLGGPIPPSIGAYVEATTLLNFGAITHNGATIEWEGRGAGAYSERRTLYGIGPYRAWRIKQGSELVNYYKDPIASRVWRQRMSTELQSDAIASVNRLVSNSDMGSYMSLTEVTGDPAKQIYHDDTRFHRAFLGVPRGWQMWEYVGGEFAICDPFLTHMGVTVRAGFDLSEVMDFVLGFLFVDFKHDDRQLTE